MSAIYRQIPYPFITNGRRTLHSQPPTPERQHNPIIAYSIKDACRVSSLGRTKIFGLIADGKLQSRKIGKRTLIPAESLQKLITEGA
ncbi:helix-turn-helix domain-containing protein [Parasphingorhabdus sp.]|uniref:helix-turn-helix domain-containing protein n=1 Tax=Parasphingorhabdus sp. TaxID=2709688 RepID=UPI003D29DAF3